MTLPITVASGCTNAVGIDLRDQVAERVDGHRPERSDRRLPVRVSARRRRALVRDHAKRLDEDGYTIVEDAIEPDAASTSSPTELARPRDVLRRPAGRELVRGRADAARLQPARARPGLGAGPGAPERAAASSRGVLDPGCLDLVVVVDHDPARRDRAADPRRRPAAPDPEAARARRSATRCGRSPTSPRRTARPASSPARTATTTPPTTAQPYDSIAGGDAEGQRARSGTAASGTAAARTPPTRPRVGIAMNYCAGFIRQQENQQLGIPREIAARLRAAPARARRVQRLQRARRPHQQAQPGRDPRRVADAADDVRRCRMVWDASAE